MRRLVVAPRPQWEQRVEALGLLYHTQAAPYWFESAYYSFSSDEVDVLERATNELHARCIDAAQHIIENGRYDELSIPARIIPLIEHSWETDQPSLYGRFDFTFDGAAAPKLLEYNADTPTSLLEAGIIQWFWREDVQLGTDQFNSIHERLVLTWRELSPRLDRSRILSFASVDDREDEATITYLRDTAEASGIRTASIRVSEIGWDDRRHCFVDLEFQPIGQIFKLYPWEWLAREEFTNHLIESFESTLWIEPAWKMLLSNKGLLPILWELFPDHPNLLESHFAPGHLGEYARKPLLSREGANITLLSQAGLAISPGDYGEEGYIYQALAPLPVFHGAHAVIGSWIIGGEAAGIGVRESDGPITDNLSRFVPHVIGRS